MRIPNKSKCPLFAPYCNCLGRNRGQYYIGTITSVFACYFCVLCVHYDNSINWGGDPPDQVHGLVRSSIGVSLKGPHQTTPTFNDKDRNPPFYNILIIKITINLNITRRVVNNNDDKDDRGLVFVRNGPLTIEFKKMVKSTLSKIIKSLHEHFFFYFYTIYLQHSKIQPYKRRVASAITTSSNGFQ